MLERVRRGRPRKDLGELVRDRSFRARRHHALLGGPLLDDPLLATLQRAGIERRGPYHLRHTFATEALAAGVSIFELARLMGTSVRMIDKTYGHLALDSEESLRARLDARAAARAGVEVATHPEAE